MKKSSNFLKSSKDKLTKGFNSSKCKTSLKLASSRLKLLKNKKEVQVKQMRRELGQLLESGHNQTARIRVEHVVREEKMMAVYDLLEIYCELIVARLPIIESQKNCPIDLKEAITSVVFASPRCGDIPELADARKHFTGKYGKEFINAAVELRPDCGVSRLLIEKLSAKAPDGQAKLKILTAIADEQGIKWDPDSFGASDLPVNDLLNGPNTFEKASKVHEEHSPSEYRDFRPTTHSQVPNESSKTAEEKFRSSMARQSFASPQGGTSGTLPSQSSQLEQRHSAGFRSERTDAGQSFPEDGNFSNGRQNWNMEFKDAASAAQAAAESAERASMAARAAAKLSRMSEKYQTESPTSQVVQKGYTSAASIREAEKHHHQDLPDRNSRFQNNNNMMKASSHEEPDRSREKNLSKEEQGEVEKVANKPTSAKFEPQYMSGYEEDINYFGKESGSVEVNNVPSTYDSRTSMDGDHSHNQNVTYEAGKNLFAAAEKTHVEGNLNTNSHDAEFAVFDKSSSDGDDYDDIHSHTEPLYDDQQAKLYFPSPERKLPESSLTSQIFVQRRYSPPESPKSFEEPFGVKPHELNSTHATFDDSDGMDSETEDTEIHSEHFQTRGSRSSEARGTERENSSQLLNARELDYSYSYGNAVNTNYGSQSSLSVSNVAKDNSHLLRSTGAWRDDEKTQSISDSDNGNKLEFGKLRGGFRHKGYITPPYTNVYQNTNPTSVNTTEEVSASPSAHLNQGNKSNSKMPTPSYNLVDTDSSEEEELSRQISSVRRKEAETKPMPKVSPPSSETNRGSQFSRRTKVFPPKTYLDEEKRKTSATEQEPSYERKTESSINTEIPKASGGSGNSLAREEESTSKHPSHVHPKLPDYDTIALKLQSLRMNRK